MIIIIDAYNLLRTVPPYHKTISDKERRSFLIELATYAQRKNHKMVVVFDGGSYSWPFKENISKRMCVVYSGANESADDYIKQYCKEHTSQDLLLVSSDRELNGYAERLRIASIDSYDFYQMVSQELQTTSKSSKTTNSDLIVLHESAQEIDDLMRQASENIQLKSEDFVDQSKRQSKKSHLSKHERALLKKLNKL